MTIYILSMDKNENASWLDDKSLNVMIRDIAQVLCNVHWFKYKSDQRFDGIPLKAKNIMGKLNSSNTSIKHSPISEWTQWARKCKQNYLYLVDLLHASINDHGFRYEPDEDGEKYKRQYQYFDRYNMIYLWARDNVPGLPDFNPVIATPFPLAMPKKYKFWFHDMYNVKVSLEHDISSYRNFYLAKLNKRYKQNCNSACDSTCIGNIQWTNRIKPEWINLI